MNELDPVPTLKSMLAPPVVRKLPAASFAVSLTVTLLPDATELDPPTIDSTDVAVEIAPGFTVMPVVDETLVPAIVAPRVVSDPETLPVKVAV